MFEDILLDMHTKLALALIFGYVLLRISVYGIEKTDKRILWFIGGVPMLASLLFIYTGEEIIMSAMLVFIVAWVMMWIFYSGVPGLKISIPGGTKRGALLIEFAVAAALIFVLVSQLNLEEKL